MPMPTPTPTPPTMPSAPTKAVLLTALATVIDANTGRDFVSGKQLKNLRVEGADVTFDIEPRWRSCRDL